MRENDEKVINGADKIARHVLLLNVKVLGLALGLLFGLAIFIATNWLIIKDGDPVGPHLQLLGQYFIGYRVTFRGSLIGFVYGAALGALAGTLFGWIYNGIVEWKGDKKGSML